MQDILDQLKENPEILQNLLNDKEHMKDIQNEIFKKTEVNEKTIKLIIKAMQICIQNENKINALNESELDNIQGGLAIPAFAIRLACSIILSQIGGSAGLAVGRKLTKHGHYPYSKSSVTDSNTPDEIIYDQGWMSGHTEGVIHGIGMTTGVIVANGLSEQIISFLKKHNVNIK